MISLAEKFHFEKSASIAFDWSNETGLSPNLITTERDNKSAYSRDVTSFSVCLMKSWLHHDEIFALLR